MGQAARGTNAESNGQCVAICAADRILRQCGLVAYQATLVRQQRVVGAEGLLRRVVAAGPAVTKEAGTAVQGCSEEFP